MAFPIRATMADIEAVCSYLLSKPTGASPAEAKAVLDSSVLDHRKISALKSWGLIEIDENSGKMRLAERGRRVARDKGARKAPALREALGGIAGYRTVVERAVRRNELTIAATEVAAYWHQHYRDDASDSDETINQQAICFFQLAEGADLGRLVVGRKGQPTRFEFHEGNARAFVDGSTDDAAETTRPKRTDGSDEPVSAVVRGPVQPDQHANRVFITHGTNEKIFEQIKRTVISVGFEPVISGEVENAGNFIDQMRTCSAVVIHVSRENDGKGKPQLNANALLEIGAALMHGRDRVVLVVEEGIYVPANLQGLCQIQYSGDSLDWDAGLKIQEALRGLRAAAKG